MKINSKTRINMFNVLVYIHIYSKNRNSIKHICSTSFQFGPMKACLESSCTVTCCKSSYFHTLQACYMMRISNMCVHMHGTIKR